MTSPTDPSRFPEPSGRDIALGEGSPNGSPTSASPPRGAPVERRRPWAWIVACVVLLLVAGGFAVWAFGLSADLDDQKDQTAQAQQDADQAKQAAEDANSAFAGLAAQVDQISQGIQDAGDELAQAGEDATQNAQAAIDGVLGWLAALKDLIAKAREGKPEASANPAAEQPTADAQATATP
jgi:hypothetical protein